MVFRFYKTRGHHREEARRRRLEREARTAKSQKKKGHNKAKHPEKCTVAQKTSKKKNG